MNDLTDERLLYVMRDATEAARAMIDVNQEAECKYLRQIEEAARALDSRKRYFKGTTAESCELSIGDTVCLSKMAMRRMRLEMRGITGTLAGFEGTTAKIENEGITRYIPAAYLLRKIPTIPFF